MSLPDAKRQIVFYSEGRASNKYLEPIVLALLESRCCAIAYLTSDSSDPILLVNDPRVHVFYIGAGNWRTFLFLMLKAGILVMTVPDLETFHIKRSRAHAVHYAYVQHSVVSTHMIYRQGAFDHFDSILCAGPHQMAEIRAWEGLNGLPTKRLFEHGYAPIDALLELKRGTSTAAERLGGSLRVLVAPSWGPEGLLESGAEPLIDTLLRAGYHVSVRPHPRTLQIGAKKVRALARNFREYPRFALDIDTASLRSLLDAHVMISDWSGVAMEFVFGLERPALFIDTPRKMNNPRWVEIDIAPLEVFYRSQVGAILELNNITSAPIMVRRLYESSSAIAEHARLLRAKFVFNAGTSARCGANIIADLAGLS